ncbi:MAG: tRNA 2-thiouridine(34) synthase MnmA [Candidatus Omnitrophica bacterium]|nr:tRNA 2-thiouridine(34) synthase MnmA [Candidatus Omnitrophota bacterium]
MKKRIVVAMSGGLDSSVTAALLKREGYEVIGITMCFNLEDSLTKKPSCCGPQAIEDARRVAEQLDIKHYILNFSDILKKKIIDDFLKEYLRGRTPNPCIRCNRYIKFDALLKKTLSLGADFLATGHYARAERVKGGYILKKAKDNIKDQSYFLYLLNQIQLKRVIFPLGEYTKEEVKVIAKDMGLVVADKMGSQDICFIRDRNLRKFLETNLKGKIKPGLIKDKEGNILGKHPGICFYTIGQREGLGISKGCPLYVTMIDKKTDTIIVGEKDDLYSKQLFIKKPHFILKPIKNKVVLKVKIRYNHREALALVYPFREGLKVIFKEPQLAITPGQSAVLYKEDTVLGGGIIEV